MFISLIFLFCHLSPVPARRCRSSLRTVRQTSSPGGHHSLPWCKLEAAVGGLERPRTGLGLAEVAWCGWRAWCGLNTFIAEVLKLPVLQMHLFKFLQYCTNLDKVYVDHRCSSRGSDYKDPSLASGSHCSNVWTLRSRPPTWAPMVNIHFV